MGKLALWALVAVVVMLLLRTIGVGKRRPRDERAEGESGGDARQPQAGDPERRGDAGELMLGCAVCGMHVPSSDAVFARGKVFCGPEHRDQDERRAGAKAPK